jgi:hypothetical protein
MLAIFNHPPVVCPRAQVQQADSESLSNNSVPLPPTRPGYTIQQSIRCARSSRAAGAAASSSLATLSGAVASSLLANAEQDGGIFLVGNNVEQGGDIVLVGNNIERGGGIFLVSNIIERGGGILLIGNNVERGGSIFLGNIKRHTLLTSDFRRLCLGYSGEDGNS